MKKIRTSPFELSVAPPPEEWDHWKEPDADAWPQKKTRSCSLIPTICFNCESACGLLAYLDNSSGEIIKFEGNPVHPGSRGRTCAKGPATLNQIKDPERILEPLKRTGPRGSGQFAPVSWDEALDDIAARIGKALDENRPEAIMYHVGRPGDDHFVLRMLKAWGIDGHNSHTTVCSAAARTGFALWCGYDRPSPDFENADFILLLSAHLETGHYFNPHAQRIMGAKEKGARLAVVDTRLSNTASHADLWISPWPGSEAALLLGVARELLETDSINRDYVKRWVNWESYLEAKHPGVDRTFDNFLEALKKEYARFTPEFVAEECRIPVESVSSLAHEIRRAGTRFASHLWRNAASGNLGGWQVARSLLLLHVLTGSFGVKGGFNPSSWDKFVPKPTQEPPDIQHWNELIWPKEFPLSHYEMSFLLPHLQQDRPQKLDVYFSRVYNPVWTNPDGFSWVEMLESEERIGCHVALTPIWSETAQWADYVLPTGLSPERHDLMSQETHAGTWIGFRQPVARELAHRQGKNISTRESNPGEVWEEAEFWIELTHRIDPDRTRGIGQWFASPHNPKEPISIDDYYTNIFENSVPGLPQAAALENMTPLKYMRRYGAYEVPYAGQERYAATDDDGQPRGFPTPSKKLEFYSPTLAEWGFEEYATPGYIQSHVHWRELAADQMVLLPTFRFPTLIHTRSSNSKWLQEISHTNPLWIHPADAERLGLENQGLARVSTEIGHFVNRIWITEGIHPGIVACSHHVGRWRLFDRVGGHAMASSRVKLTRKGSTFSIRQSQGATSPKSSEGEPIWWKEVGVNQNLTFAVQPDPVSGMHCWHQRVRVTPPQKGDHYGDVFVDTQKSREVYKRWLSKTRPPQGTLRRPLWLNRPLHPAKSTYELD